MIVDKRTRIATCYLQNIFLGDLQRTCLGDHEHVILSGCRPRAGQPQKTMVRTKNGSSAYPVDLCDVWANLVKDLVVAIDIQKCGG